MVQPSLGRSQLGALRMWLPEGKALPEDVWRSRHLGIVVLLWCHVVVIPLYALLRGFSLAHALLESAFVLATALVAMSTLPRRARTAVASVGLLSCSAVLVHLSGGLIEMHFHFFVMVAVVALYQDWVPFFTAIGYVIVHHGVLGVLSPQSVFNHPAALNNPWRWAMVHAFFIAAISVACLVAWRLNERMIDERREAERLLRDESRIVQTLYEVGQTVAAELDAQRVVQAVTDAATQLTHADFGAFFYNVVDRDGESYMLYALSGAPAEAFAKLGMPRNTPLFAETFAGRAVVRLDDVTRDQRYGRLPPHHGLPAGHLPVRAYLAVPVKSRTGEVLGGLFFGHPRPGRFTRVDERLASGIAAHAAIAIDNARLYESERLARESSDEARTHLEVLASASKALTSSFELDVVLSRLVTVVTATLGADCLIDLMCDDNTMRRAAATTADFGQTEPDPPPLGAEHPIMGVIGSGEAKYFDNTPLDLLTRATSEPPAWGHETRRSTAIAAPILGRREPLGVLWLISREDGTRQCDAHDLAFAEELARRAATAVENTRLYARQRTVAETLQHSLLPERLPEIPGIATAARYLAGGPDVDIGGDWYDVLQLPNGRTAFALGDVVGRGERAAALMGQLRNSVRAYTMDGKSPCQIASCLNQMLLDTGREEMATMIYAVLDLETGELRYVNAGHPPPLTADGHGDARYLDRDHGMPLGALSSADYREVNTALAPGDMLLLYTDGLVEDRALTLEQGLAGLREAVVAGPDDLQQLCSHLLTQRFHGQPPTDDVALLAVRLLPVGDRLYLQLPAHAHVLAPLRATLRRWLAAAGADEREIFELLVAVGEASTNAIRHAHGPTTSSFELEATSADDVVIAVRDHGRWRERRTSDGGYGLAIIEQYVDHVELLRASTGTDIRMRRKLAAKTPQVL